MSSPEADVVSNWSTYDIEIHGFAKNDSCGIIEVEERKPKAAGMWHSHDNLNNEQTTHSVFLVT
jgi:hypothetical protein